VAEQAEHPSGGDGLPNEVDAVVVGAGLAGLAAATTLHRAGARVVVLEAADAAGGRVRTDVVDGLRLDRGFQVLNPGYPTLAGMVDLDALDLRAYDAGVRVHLGDRGWVVADPRRVPTAAVSSLRAPVGSVRDKAGLVALALRVSTGDVQRFLRAPDSTAREGFRAAGISDRLVDTTLRPFLAGVFLEPDLQTSYRLASLILRSFVRGSPSLPALGIQALPDALAAALPAGAVRTGVPVAAVRTGVVTTAGGARIRARAVLVATDAPAAARLLPGLDVPAGRSVTTWYHLADDDPAELADGRRILTVDGQARGPVVNTSVLTTVAPSYGPPGAVLVASSCLGVDDSSAAEAATRAHLSLLYGVSADRWQTVRPVVVPWALPAQPPPLAVRRPVRYGAGIWVCGDHRDTASVQGALVSGRRAARDALARLGAVAAAMPRPKLGP
jgi:phytoene dehydrogenase-like protein